MSRSGRRTEKKTDPRAAVGGRDRRRMNRRACEATVAVSMLCHDGTFTRPLLVQAVDISTKGIAIITRQMMRRGAVGALQLNIPGRRMAVVGVEVMNCDYLGEMKHRVGLLFTPLHWRFANSPSFLAGARTLKQAEARKALENAKR